MPAQRPSVVVTRRLPEPVETRSFVSDAKQESFCWLSATFSAQSMRCLSWADEHGSSLFLTVMLLVKFSCELCRFPL